jgi:hypothetical protein
VLTTDTEAPVVTKTTVGADLLQALEILTDLAVQGVGNNLGVLAIGDVALSVKEPRGNLVLGGSLEDGDDTLELFGGELTSTVDWILVSLVFFVGLCESRSISACPILPMPLSFSSIWR